MARQIEIISQLGRKYDALKHWLKDNHPEAFEEYINRFYTITDNSFEEIPNTAEYTGDEHYPRYNGDDGK